MRSIDRSKTAVTIRRIGRCNGVNLKGFIKGLETRRGQRNSPPIDDSLDQPSQELSARRAEPVDDLIHRASAAIGLKNNWVLREPGRRRRRHVDRRFPVRLPPGEEERTGRANHDTPPASSLEVERWCRVFHEWPMIVGGTLSVFERQSYVDLEWVSAETHDLERYGWVAAQAHPTQTDCVTKEFSSGGRSRDVELRKPSRGRRLLQRLVRRRSP